MSKSRNENFCFSNGKGNSAMKTFYLITWIALIATLSSLSAQTTDSIVKKRFSYYYGEENISKTRRVDSVLSICPLALQQYKTGKSLSIAGSIFMLGGCILTIKGLSPSSGGGGDSNNAIFLGIGIPCYVLGAALSIGSIPAKKRAIASFNARRCKVPPKPQFNY